MSKLFLIAVSASLAALPAAAAAQIAVSAATTQQERTFDVEVLSSDPDARTLTIRSDTGTATLLVDEVALRGLQGLQPGSRVTITVRNSATGQQEAITTIVSGTLRSRPGTAVQTSTTTYRRVVGMPVKVSALDRDTRTITVLNGDRPQSFVVAADAARELDSLAPGQQALLSWRFNRDGKAEAVIRVAPSTVSLAGPRTVTRTVVDRAGGPFQVVAVDRDARLLTFSDEAGVSQTVLVDEGALLALGDLNAGDSVLLSWGDDRVLVITRQ
jgi:hypothetical protein